MHESKACARRCSWRGVAARACEADWLRREEELLLGGVLGVGVAPRKRICESSQKTRSSACQDMSRPPAGGGGEAEPSREAVAFCPPSSRPELSTNMHRLACIGLRGVSVRPVFEISRASSSNTSTNTRQTLRVRTCVRATRRRHPYPSLRRRLLLLLLAMLLAHVLAHLVSVSLGRLAGGGVGINSRWRA